MVLWILSKGQRKKKNLSTKWRTSFRRATSTIDIVSVENVPTILWAQRFGRWWESEIDFEIECVMGGHFNRYRCDSTTHWQFSDDICAVSRCPNVSQMESGWFSFMANGRRRSGILSEPSARYRATNGMQTECDDNEKLLSVIHMTCSKANRAAMELHTKTPITIRSNKNPKSRPFFMPSIDFQSWDRIGEKPCTSFLLSLVFVIISFIKHSDIIMRIVVSFRFHFLGSMHEIEW